MKKIYLSIAGIFACCTILTSQNQIRVPSQHFGKETSGTKTSKKLQNVSLKTQGGVFAVVLDPIAEIMTRKQINLTGANADVGIFLAGVFQDSTVSIVTPGGSLNISDYILLGTTLDPKSSLLQASGVGLVSASDPYNIDTIAIQGSYVKKTPDTDTLYVWLVWGDTTNTAVYNKGLTSSFWISPISGWRRSVIGPKLTGATGAHGNKVKPSAPASNMKLIKYVLQPDDSVSVYGRSANIIIPLTDNSPLGVTIPAGNIVSCFYTFVPGGAHTLNQPMYSFSSSVIPTINGFCGGMWAQTGSLSNPMNYQVDNDGWNMGQTYERESRYAMTSSSNHLLGDLMVAAKILFSITGNSTVGVHSLNKEGFILGQNTPNPFTGGSTIEYVLDKEAYSGKFTITDVMGRVVNTEYAETSKGAHFIQIGSYAPGVYYYSLNIDGKITTKKMLVQ